MTSNARNADGRSRVDRRGVLLGALLIARAVAAVGLARRGSPAPVHTKDRTEARDTRGWRGSPPAAGVPARPLRQQQFRALRAAAHGAARARPARSGHRIPLGGDLSYCHSRASGAWGSYVLDEVIPKALTVLNADPRRVAIGGLSMCGFGAYSVARLRPGRF